MAGHILGEDPPPTLPRRRGYSVLPEREVVEEGEDGVVPVAHYGGARNLAQPLAHEVAHVVEGLNKRRR